MTQCMSCGKDTKNKKYCSRSCAAKENKKNNNVLNRTIGHYRKRSDIRNFARKYNSHLSDESCAMCGYKLHVEICHIIALKDFPDTALISEVNHPNNLVALCPNCHWEFDNLYKNNDYGAILSMVQSSKLPKKIDKTFFIDERRYDLSVR